MENLYDNTILIVDDTPENIDILVELLEDFDKQIAISGEDALETAFEGEPPDLILLDIMMPEMDGYEVCRRLRANEKTKDIPIIFLTAKTQKDDIIKGFEVGGQDYLTKPFDARELMVRVKTQLELKSQREILKNMNTLLEEKVQERTARLKEAYKNLEKANQELLSLDEAKNSFLTMISHEIRTPLNGIIGASYFLKSTLAEDKELSEFVEMLQVSADRLEHFSLTALLITQLQAGYKITTEKVEPDKLVEECIKENQDKAKAKEISVVKEKLVENAVIEVEKPLIKRALNSIIDNAIKYSNQKDTITIKEWNDNGKLSIACFDNGRSFTQEALDRLFKPFGLGEQHYDNNVGLSLKAAKLIMDVHGGDIQISNLKDGGACVSLIF